jgi:hypothetical protein
MTGPLQASPPLAEILRGSTDEKALVPNGFDPVNQTESSAFLGLRDSLSGLSKTALPHFCRVRHHGVSTNSRSRIARPRSIGSKACDESARRCILAPSARAAGTRYPSA